MGDAKRRGNFNDRKEQALQLERDKLEARRLEIEEEKKKDMVRIGITDPEVYDRLKRREVQARSMCKPGLGSLLMAASLASSSLVYVKK